MKKDLTDAAAADESTEMAGLKFYSFGTTVDLMTDDEEGGADDSGAAGPSQPTRHAKLYAKRYGSIELRLKRPSEWERAHSSLTAWRPISRSASENLGNMAAGERKHLCMSFGHIVQC